MGAFDDVRAAFCVNTRNSLESIGVQIHAKASQPKWISVCCPLCPDSSGSASVALQNGHLVCHQCGYKNDLFRWVAKKEQLKSDWEACKWLAGKFNVSIEIQKQSGRGRPSKEVSPDFIKRAQQSLFNLPESDPIRLFLGERALGKDSALLERLGVGVDNGRILFFQIDPLGNFKDRYRIYNPATKGWAWNKGEDEPLGFWPGWKIDGKNQHVWIFEGEWDTWTALEVLRLHEQGIHCYTWTGGAGSPVLVDRIPSWMREQYVHICYDNDVFQGPDIGKYYAPDDKKMAELRRRRENLIHGVAENFRKIGCQVWFHQVPIEAEKQWGADFRDWVASGGRVLENLPGYTWNEVVHVKGRLIHTSLPNVYKLAKHRVKFSCVVNHIEEDGVSIPITCRVDCAMGQFDYCKKCKVPTLASDGILDLKNRPEDAINAVLSGDASQYIKKNVFGVPSACNICTITTDRYDPGCVWSAIRDDASSSDGKELLLVGKRVPALSDELEVIGDVYHHKNTVAVKVKRLNVLDRTDIDLKLYHGELLELCPWETNDPSVIQDYLQKRAKSLADNVTHIYGRENIHIAAEMVTHSALWFELEGHRRRGWLDACILGPTRTGKSMTVRHLMQYHGLGAMHTCLENISRAGLTMGGAQGRGTKMKLKPGLFPRAHKKMIVLDEFHTMVTHLARNPMLDLMSARDAGTVGGVKIYGAKQLPAASRLITICNWVRGKAETFEFPCQHFLYLYGAPESLSRLDFGLVVPEFAEDQELIGGGSEHVWTRDLMRAMILRAWGQKPANVRFEPEAVQTAKEICRIWESVYDESLPLFVRAEKHYSVLRMAAAIANLRVGHPQGDFATCLIRTSDVEVAVNFLETTWKENGYAHFSKAAVARRDVPQCFHVEAEILVTLHLTDSEQVRNLLPNLFGPVAKTEITSTIGLPYQDAEKWVSNMIRYNALEKVKHPNSYNVEWRLTKGAHQILKNLIMIAEEFPREIERRHYHLKNWHFGSKTTNPDMMPMTASSQEIRNELLNKYSATGTEGMIYQMDRDE